MDIVRLSDSVASILEKRILEGSLRAGERLPSERELAEQLGVSRPSLREALQKLAAKGLVRTRQGGGTVVTDRLQASFVDPWKDMLSGHPALQHDLLEFRHMLEGQAAQLAAERANDFDIKRIDAAFHTLEAAYQKDELDACIKADVDFHQAIAEASHNVLIAHLSASLHRLIHEDIQRNLHYLHDRPDKWFRLREQHHEIWAKTRAREPEAAAAAARNHIVFVKATMSEAALELSRRESAMRRVRSESKTP
ncbi:MAG: GntR family transcriptional regulator [Thiomonas sp.]|jgi:GntR family transcriptional repressor for pyruvate dehydrogenase complex